MSVRATISNGLKPLVNIVYPPRCPSCGEAVASQSGLCVQCWKGIVATHEQMGIEEETSHDTKPVIAATPYNDISRKLILNFKHGGKVSLAKPLGKMIASHLPIAEAGDVPLLIPVPLHRTRLWQRGYNQAALLAHELSKHDRGELLVDGLIRKKRTASLGGLGKTERFLELKGSIAVRNSRIAAIKERRIILVDDVFTSGATSEACMSALQAAGALSIQLACFARVKD